MLVQIGNQLMQALHGEVEQRQTEYKPPFKALGISAGAGRALAAYCSAVLNFLVVEVKSLNIAGNEYPVVTLPEREEPNQIFFQFQA